MKKIRIGVFGAGRGMDLATNFQMLGCEIVALCDSRREMLDKFGPQLSEGGKTYEDFDSFIQHEMDAIILANNFHEHAPYAIRCLEKGIHVFCECISNGTMADGVALIRAAEKSDAVFFLAENYPQMTFNREITRICREGSLGKILYAEGEYNHPTAWDDVWFLKTYRYNVEHWRSYLPVTYYITHSLGPIMRATGASPKRVASFAIFAPSRVGAYNGDNSAIVITQNDDDSVFRVVPCGAFGAHDNAYRICGMNGQVENVRGMGDKILLRYNSYSCPEDMQETNMYDAVVPDEDDAIRPQTGHGGSDYLTARMFLRCIEHGTQPEFPFDVHAAVTMSSVAILAHRSVLAGGAPYDVPDFHDEAQRVRYENDRLSPFVGPDGSAPTLPCCSHPDYRPSAEELAEYEELLKR